MKRHRTNRAALGWALTAGLVASISISAVASAQSQNSSGTNPANLGKVTVTGSRIKRSTLATAQPVVRISHQDIEASGATSIGELLRNLPSVTQTQGTTFGGYQSNGSAHIDLRYLGSNRILVLVNGERWITNFSGSTDLNTIPVSIIDHIEILQNGASALYGSDAIAGVVNIITRKNFNGGEASAYYGIDNGDGHWDGQTQAYAFTLGHSTDKWSLLLNASYRTAKAIPSEDRDFSQYPVRGTGNTRGNSATAAGRFIFNPPSGGDPTKPGNPPADFTGLTLSQCPDQQVQYKNRSLYLPHCDLTIKPGASGQNPANYVPFKPQDLLNVQALTPLTINQDIKSAYAAGSYNFTPWLSFHTNVFYTDRHSANNYEYSQIYFNRAGETIGADQKYNPFGFTLSTTEPVEVAPGVYRPTLNAIYKTISAGGPKHRDYDRQTYRFQGGFSGNFTTGPTYWDWNLDYIYMKTKATSAIAHIANGFTLDYGLSGPDRCGTLVGCVPLNLFGGANGMTPAQVRYEEYRAVSTSEKGVRVLDANISTSNLVSLPAGGLGLAVGYQHRNIFGEDNPDTSSELKSGHQLHPSSPEKGSYNVDSAYAEINVPILSKLPGVNDLNADIATRYADYSTFGSTDKSRYALEYRPVSDLLLRATYSEGFRAGDIDDLFSPSSVFNPDVKDPCSNYTTSGVSQVVQQRCKAAGVPASYSQLNPQINASSGGNPDLKPETSVSKTAGFVYSPSQLPGLDVSAGYYDILLRDTITTIDTQQLFDFCYLQGKQSFCNDIQRGSGGDIVFAENQTTNIGSTETTGVDIGADYRFPSTSFGDFKLAGRATHVNSYEIRFPQPSGTTSITKVVGNRDYGAVPEWKAMLRLYYRYGPWSAALTGHYISGLTERCSDSLDGTPLSFTNLGLCSEPNKQHNGLSRNYISSVTWYDLQASYELPVNVTLSLGVRNLFEREPPREVRKSYGTAGDPQLYSDLIGRFVYARLRYRF
jgi:iron complex outermembrane receptor protein